MATAAEGSLIRHVTKYKAMPGAIVLGNVIRSAQKIESDTKQLDNEQKKTALDIKKRDVKSLEKDEKRAVAISADGNKWLATLLFGSLELFRRYLKDEIIIVGEMKAVEKQTGGRAPDWFMNLKRQEQKILHELVEDIFESINLYVALGEKARKAQK